METAKLTIGGMTCEGCVRTVERRLKSIAGVQSVKVRLAAGEADVEYRSGELAPATLTEAVQKLGYQASLQ